ncbi:MAG: prephenate dehydrogenase [Bacteroidota bacterium]|nr:prephenate dehydrogenase [Bacteroidota bacterium]
MRTAIIGLGLIGGSIALDLRKRGFSDELIGVDKNIKNSEKALELGLVDRIAGLDEAIKISDLIILSVPVSIIVELLPYILSNMKKGAILTDVGSTKEAICKSVEDHPNRQCYVSSHPMAGTENSGPEAALVDLFNNKTCIICDIEKSNKKALNVIKKMYACLGMRIVYMEPAEHDLHTAYVSHLSHITSFALANAVLEKEQDSSAIFNLAGGGFESTARLGKSSPEMWAPIFNHNKENISEALDLYIKHISMFKKCIDENDSEGYIKLMRNANSIRRVLNNIPKIKKLITL